MQAVQVKKDEDSQLVSIVYRMLEKMPKLLFPILVIQLQHHTFNLPKQHL